MKIGFMQFAPVFGEKQANFDTVEGMLANTKADLLVLPELFATGYSFVSAGEVLDLSEPKGGQTARFLQHIAGMCNAVVIGGFVELENGNCFNSALMADASGIITIYRKLHRFNKEKLWFSPGNRIPEPVTVQGVKIGIMICFDWIFPETCRTLALKGTQIIAHPSNLVLPWAQKAMTTRCLENHLFAVTSNRTGNEKRGGDSFTFTGQSQITGCQGEILASATAEESCVKIVDVAPEMASDKSVNPYNDLFKDRRCEFYDL